MACVAWLVIAGSLLLAVSVLWLMERRRNNSFCEYKERKAGHVPPRQFPLPNNPIPERTPELRNKNR